MKDAHHPGAQVPIPVQAKDTHDLRCYHARSDPSGIEKVQRQPTITVSRIEVYGIPNPRRWNEICDDFSQIAVGIKHTHASSAGQVMGDHVLHERRLTGSSASQDVEVLSSVAHAETNNPTARPGVRHSKRYCDRHIQNGSRRRCCAAPRPPKPLHPHPRRR